MGRRRRRIFRKVADGAVDVLAVLQDIAGYLVSWPLQETSGAVSEADNIAVPLGRELLVKDFTAGLWSVSGATIDDADSFTTAAKGRVRANDPSIAVGKPYTARFKGTTTATSINIRDFGLVGIYKTIVGGGAFDESFTFTGTNGQGIAIENQDAGTTDIDWPNTTIKQTDILASSAFDPATDNPLTGDDTGTTPGVAMGNSLSKTDDGATSKTELGLPEYNSMIDPVLFHIGIAIQKAVWDTTERYFFSHIVDPDNWIKIGGTTTAGQLVYEIRAGGTTEQVLHASGSPTGIIMPSISSKGGTMKAWLGSTQVGGDVAIANTLTGNFVTMIMGANDDTPTKVDLANRAWYWHYSDEKTSAELATIASAIGASQ